MDKYFSLVFWGLLIVIVDISIDQFDLFVDGIGYLMVAGGCRGLTTHSPQFARARVLCFVLAVMWLIRFVVEGDLATIFGIATTIVDCSMIWSLLGGIADLALKKNRRDLATRAYNRRVAYLVFMVVASILVIVARDSADAAVAAGVIIIAMLIILVLVLNVIHRAKKELSTKMDFSPKGGKF